MGALAILKMKALATRAPYQSTKVAVDLVDVYSCVAEMDYCECRFYQELTRLCAAEHIKALVETENAIFDEKHAELLLRMDKAEFSHWTIKLATTANLLLPFTDANIG